MGSVALPCVEPYPVGLVGCGRMGSLHAATILRNPRLRLTEVLDPDPQAARRWVEAAGARRVAQVNTPLVVLAAPAHLLWSLAQPLVDQGRFCLIEKPLLGVPRSALPLPRVRVGLLERFNPAVRALAAARPDLRPQRLSFHREGPCPPQTTVDALDDLMVHDLDLADRWCPGLEVLAAGGERDAQGRLAKAWARLRGPGAEVYLSAWRGAPERRRFAVLESGDERWQLDLVAGTAVGPPGLLPPQSGDALTCQLEAWLEAIEVGGGAAATAEDALRATALADQVRRLVGEGA